MQKNPGVKAREEARNDENWTDLHTHRSNLLARLLSFLHRRGKTTPPFERFAAAAVISKNFKSNTN